MGWFDNEKDDKQQGPEPVRRGAPASSPATAPAPTPPARSAGGSTLGEHVHVNGTIVCDETLRILGKVEGTIRAREDLLIAKGAEVRAVIHGVRVHVEGHVKGDVHAGEVVVLGPTAVLEGNIGTPSLEVQEGAFFKGSVEMRPAEPEKPAAKQPAANRVQARPEPSLAKVAATKKDEPSGDSAAQPAVVAAGADRTGKRG